MNGPESGSLQTVRGYPDGMSIQEQIGIGDGLPEGKTSIFWAIFLVVNAALGAGLLTFPLSFYMTGGIVSGIVIELLLIFFVVGGVLILVYSADITQSPTYETTVEAICGPVAKILAELCLVAFCFGSNTAYLVVIGDQVEDITDAFHYHGHNLSHYWWANRKFLITAIAMLFIFPWLFIKRIGVLSYTSFLSVLCCFYIAIVITVRYFHPHQDGSCIGKGVPSSCSRGVPDIFLAVPFICFGYQCHVSSIPVYTDLKNRNFKSFVYVIVPSVLICFCVYTFAGAFGLLAFDHRSICIAPDILRNYCPTDIPIDVARVVLAVVIVTSYPILTFCGRTALDSIIMKLWRFIRRWLTHNPPEETVFYSGSPTPKTEQAPKKNWNISEYLRLLVESIVWFFISLLLALFVPVISYIISLTGGLAASFIFLFPGVILLKLMLRPGSEQVYSTWQRICFVAFGCLITVLGTFIFCLSVVYTIMNDANLF